MHQRFFKFRSKNGKEDSSFVFTRPKTPLGFIEDLPTANFVSPVVVAQHGSSMSAAKDSVSNATTQLSFASPSADKRSRFDDFFSIMASKPINIRMDSKRFSATLIKHVSNRIKG